MISLFNEDIMAMRIYTRAVKPAKNEFIAYPNTIWKKIIVLYGEKCGYGGGYVPNEDRLEDY